jgi:hypothetical protein
MEQFVRTLSQEDKPASTLLPPPMLNLFDSVAEEEAEPRPKTGEEEEECRMPG